MMFESNYINCLAGVDGDAKAGTTVGIGKRIRNRKR